MKITVVGGTGYAGAAIVREAAGRGHEVTVLSREAPEHAVDGVTYLQGWAHDADAVARAVAGADAVVGALAPRGDLAGHLREAYDVVVDAARATGARFVMMGGWSTLRLVEGGPRVVETGEVPAQFEAEAKEVAALLPWLEGTEETFDWLFLSPAATFGGYNPGEATGRYRVGGDVALFTEDGRSDLSGADLALAVVDELEVPAHHRAQINVAY